MSAEIYNAPEEVKQPTIDWSNYDHEKYQAACDKYLQALKAKLQEMGFRGKNVGEVVKFPIADGYAMYMVISMRPLRLMHIPLGDSYHYPNVDLMTAQRIQEVIDAQKALEEMIANNTSLK